MNLLLKLLLYFPDMIAMCDDSEDKRRQVYTNFTANKPKGTLTTHE